MASSAGVFLVPKSRTQPIVDFVIPQDNLFQVTLANRHPYVNAKLTNLVEKWGFRKKAGNPSGVLIRLSLPNKL